MDLVVLIDSTNLYSIQLNLLIDRTFLEERFSVSKNRQILLFILLLSEVIYISTEMLPNMIRDSIIRLS